MVCLRLVYLCNLGYFTLLVWFIAFFFVVFGVCITYVHIFELYYSLVERFTYRKVVDYCKVSSIIYFNILIALGHV